MITGSYNYANITAATGTVGHFTQVGLRNNQLEMAWIGLYIHSQFVSILHGSLYFIVTVVTDTSLEVIMPFHHSHLP